MFYSLTCLLFFRISFLWTPIVIDVFSDRLLSFLKLPKYQCHIRFQQYCINFVFKKKKVKIKFIWPRTDRFHRYRRALYTPMQHASASGAAARAEARACESSCLGTRLSVLTRPPGALFPVARGSAYTRCRLDARAISRRAPEPPGQNLRLTLLFLFFLSRIEVFKKKHVTFILDHRL
jgi:hypothetical protein